MSHTDSTQSLNKYPTPFLTKSFISLQKVLCFLASFDFDRYRQMKWGWSKTNIITRGVAVIIPSVVVASTLVMWGPSIFGSMGETALFAIVAPIMVFNIDFALIAQSYSGTTVSASLNFARILLLLLSITVNIFVVSGANSGSLRPDIEKDVRRDTRFSVRLDELAASEKINGEDLKKFKVQKDEAENAGKNMKRLITLRDAEIAGATLSDGVQRVQGDGTKAKGFNLEINEVSQIAAGGEQAGRNFEKAVNEAKRLQSERQKLDAEIAQEMKNRQSPSLMVSALYSKIRAGNIDVSMSTFMFLFFLVAMDCSALIMSHVSPPAGILRMAELQAIKEITEAEFDHEVELSELNSRRPHVDIKVFPGSRVQNSSTRVYNMRDANPGAEAPIDERQSA
jgi:hypothetical protein